MSDRVFHWHDGSGDSANGRRETEPMAAGLAGIKTPAVRADFAQCVVAEVGGQIVAYGNSYGNTIKNLCRLEGSHLSGTADLILESLEKIVRDEGFRDVCLYAQPAETGYPLEKLVRFYRRHGYEVNTYRQGFSIDAKPVNLGAEMIKRF
jgi:hypothetical protein